MGFRDDSRAQSVVVGSLLVFAILIVSFSAYQAFSVPNQNAQVEFNHYTEIQDDMQELREAHQQTVADGQPRSPALKLGTRYKERILAVNPPNPQGTLRSEDLGQFGLENAPEAGSGTNIAPVDVCGTGGSDSDAVRYDPSYNRLSDGAAGPIVYENTVLYREMGNGEILLESDQVLIRGSRINLLPLQSETTESGLSASYGMTSEGYGVEKELESDATPSVVVPTNLPESKWEELLASQDNVEKVVGTTNGVRIDLEALSDDDDSWTVRCAATTDPEIPPIDPPEGSADSGSGSSGSIRFGLGGVTEHTVDNNTDTVALPNGLWTDVDQIVEIRFGGSKTTAVNSNNYNTIGSSGPDGVTAMFKIKDGTSDEVIYARVNAVKGSDGSWQDKKVHLGTNPYNNIQSKALTDDAAKRIHQNGQTDILDPDNYNSPGSGDDFDRQDGNFGSYVDDIEQMNDATIQTVDIQGRLEMEVRTGAVTLDLDSDDQSQSYIYNETDEIEFNVTAQGEATDQNIDLEITDNQGQEIDSAKPRADRKTIDVDGTKDITLTWQPDWDNLNSDQTYEAVITSDDDEVVGTVTIVQQGNAYFDVRITDTNSPVDYGETLEVDIEVENTGDTAGEAQPQISVGDQDGDNQPQKTVDPGDTWSTTISYDTSNVDTSNTGELELTATTNNDEDSRTVRVENPEIILDPNAENLTAGGSGHTQEINFTLGKDLEDGDEIQIDLTDTGDAVSYNTNSNRWDIVSGDGQVDLNTNNNKVQSVKYQIGAGDSEGDTIRLEANNVNTDDADSDTRYDLEYRVTSANSYPEGQNGDTNTTSFRTRGPLEFVSMEKSKGGDIIFSIKNTDGGSVTITDASLDLTSYGDYTGKKIKFEGSDNRKKDYDADGTFKKLDDSSHTIDSNNVNKVGFRTLKDSGQLGELNLQETENNGDVVVKFKYESGAEQTFHFNEVG